MTKEELVKEAEEYALNTYEMCSYSDLPYASDRRAREQAFIAGAELREKRITELKEANETLATMNNNMWVELEKKRAESQGITNRLHQLTKAKEIIQSFQKFANNEIEYDPEHPQEHTDLWNSLCKEAEQFLKELEK